MCPIWTASTRARRLIERTLRIFIDEDGLLVVDQEPIRRKATDTHALIWRLPASQPFVFPDDNAIVLSGESLPSDLTRGVIGPQRRVFACVYTRTGPAIWKYTVRVIHKETLEPLTSLDPSVFQN